MGVGRARINPLAELVEASAHSPRALRHLDKLGARRLTHRVPFDRLRARIIPLAELVEAGASFAACPA